MHESRSGCRTMTIPSEMSVINQSRRGDGHQIDGAHPLTVFRQQACQPFDMRDPALALGSLEDGRSVVAAPDRLGQPPLEERLGPLLEEGDIVCVIHHVYGA